MLAAIEEHLDPNVLCEAVEILDEKIHEAILLFDGHENPGVALDKALEIRDDTFEDLPAPWLKQLVTEYFLFMHRERMKRDAPDNADIFQGRSG